MADSTQKNDEKSERLASPGAGQDAINATLSKSLQTNSENIFAVKLEAKSNDIKQLGFANISLVDATKAVDAQAPIKDSPFTISTTNDAKVKFVENLSAKFERDSLSESRMQERLIKLLPGFSTEGSAKENANLLKQVEDEKSRSEFGPASKSAYKLIVDQIENKYLPGLSKQMGQIGLVEKDDLTASQLPMSLGINTDASPQKDDLGKLDEAVNWILTAQLVNDAANMQTLQNDIKKYSLPQSWADSLGSGDSAHSLESMRANADLAIQAKVQIKMMNELSAIPGGEHFKNILPEGAKVVRGANNEITHIDLSLPDAAALATPEGQAKMKQLSDWVNNQQKTLAPLVKQIEELSSNSERAVYWGDMERTQSKARLDAAGNLVGITGDAAQPKQGEQLRSVNLISSTFDVVQNGNKIAVNQEIQAKNVPWWSYQNFFGAEDVGRKLNISREFDKGQLVVVPNNNGFSLVKAEDLSSYKGTQQAWHYGEKIGMTALDIGLTVSGFELLRGGVAAAQLGKVALTSALRASAEVAVSEGSAAASKVLYWQMASGATRMTVGLGGIINNAGARETTIGEFANNTRQLYFLATAVNGLTPGSLKSLIRNTALGAEGSAMLQAGGVLNTLSSADKLKAVNGLIDKVNILPSTGLTFMAGAQVVDYIRAKRNEQLLHAQKTLSYADMLNMKPLSRGMIQ